MYLHYTSLSLTHWPAYPEDMAFIPTLEIFNPPAHLLIVMTHFRLRAVLFGAQTLEKHVGGYAKVPEWSEHAGFFKGTGKNVISF